MKKILGIDVLRGIAALSVVLYHYTSRFSSSYNNPTEIIVEFPYGVHGVSLFFLISGFVIFLSIERTKNKLDFIVGRFSRLFPAYWTAVILTFTIGSIFSAKTNISIKDALINLTMLQEFLKVPHVDGVYWTLEIELSFYIIILFLSSTKLLKNINFISISWLILILVFAFLQKQEILLLDQRIRTFLLLDYAWLFIIGMLIYKNYKESFSLKRYAIVIICIFFELLKHGLESTLFLIVFIALFELILRGYLEFINTKLMLFLGNISYSLYLIHENIGFIIVKKIESYGLNLNIGILIALASVLILSATITFFIERPAMSFIRNKYHNYRSS